MGNRVTPRLRTVRVAKAKWIWIDIGIYEKPSPHLTMMAYHQSKKRWLPAVAPMDEWKAVVQTMRKLWHEFSCEHCSTKCSKCRNTNWKGYARWKVAGSKVDGENYPVF
jgi:hypothetical protein